MSVTGNSVLFAREYELIAEAEAALARMAPEAPAHDALAGLLAGFCKTLRQCGRLMSMGDRMQAQLSELNRDIAAKEARYRSIFQCAAEGVFRTGADGSFAEVNPAMANIFGWSSVDAFMQHNTSLASLFSSPQAHCEYLDRLCSAGAVSRYEAVLRRRDGTPVWVEISTQALETGPETACGATHVGVVLDVTAHRRMLEELSHMARTDPLTGLNNRRFFMEAARAEVERMQSSGRPLSLLMLDIDHFKRVNDTWGHDAGDMVLKQLSCCLAETMRGQDVCARLGGEEFAVLLPETGHAEACRAAETLRQAVAGMAFAGHGFSVTSSLGLTTLDSAGHAVSGQRPVPGGVAVSACCGQVVEILLKRADIALYAAKKNGRNRTEVYPARCTAICAGALCI